MIKSNTSVSETYRHNLRAINLFCRKKSKKECLRYTPENIQGVWKLKIYRQLFVLNIFKISATLYLTCESKLFGPSIFDAKIKNVILIF